MPPDLAKYLHDVRQACGLLENFTSGKSFSDYLADVLLRSAVERQFMIVGEALLQGGKLDATLEQSITSFREIVGFRNVLVHGYAVVNHQTVWDVIQNDVALLKQEADALLTKLGPP